MQYKLKVTKNKKDEYAEYSSLLIYKLDDVKVID